MSSALPPDGQSSEGSSASERDQALPAHGQEELSPIDTPTLDSSVEKPICNEPTRAAQVGGRGSSECLTSFPEPGETSAASDADRVKRKLRISAQLGIPLDPPQRDDAIGTMGNYQILEKVGRGGMGIVMRAFDTVLHRYVALKVMSATLISSDRARERFSREARSAAGINHPNVVTIHAIEEHDEIPYLVMEFVEGQTIDEMIRDGHQFSVEEMVRIGAQIAAGLSEAHSQGIVHRDIKPSNILLDSLQRAKISDFGLARLLMDQSDLTSQGDVLGTPSYMSPEQVRGEEAGELSDLFSLGCVFFAMLTGRSPFHATTQIGMATRIQNEQPPPIANTRTDVPVEVEDLVRDLLRKDPAERPESAADVNQRLSRLLVAINQQTSGTVSGGTLTTPTPGSRFGPAVMAVCFLIIAGIGWKLLPSRSSQQPTQQFVGSDAQNPSKAMSKADQNVVVAADGSGDFQSLGEAIGKIGPGSTIRVKQGDYVESLMLSDDATLRGLTIAGIGMPSFSAPPDRSVIEIDHVSDLTISGIKFSAQHDQSALRVRGQCEGLTIQACDFVSHEPDGSYSPLALVHIATCSGSKAKPIRLTDCRLLDSRLGLVLGVSRSGADPTQHLAVENCQIRCGSRQKGIPLVLYGRIENILLKNNTICFGRSTLSFQLVSPQVAQSILLDGNTIHSSNVVINFNTSNADQDIRLIDNLFVGNSSTQPASTKLKPGFADWFGTNGWITLGRPNDSFLSMLKTTRYSVDVLESINPNDDNYLYRSAQAPEDFPGVELTTDNPKTL